MKVFILDHDCVLELNEFVQGCMILFLNKGDNRDKAGYIFDLYDANLDGFLSLIELKDGFKALYHMLGHRNYDIICKDIAEAIMTDMGIVTNTKSSEKVKKGKDFFF